MFWFKRLPVSNESLYIINIYLYRRRSFVNFNDWNHPSKMKFNCLDVVAEWRRLLRGIFLCIINWPKQGGGVFIKAGAFIRMFTVLGRYVRALAFPCNWLTGFPVFHMYAKSVTRLWFHGAWKSLLIIFSGTILQTITHHEICQNHYYFTTNSPFANKLATWRIWINIKHQVNSKIDKIWQKYISFQIWKLDD